MIADGTQIKFRSPKNITEDDINEAMLRQSKYESMHCSKEWSRITDAKEVYKLVIGFLSGPITFYSLRTLFTMGVLIGFDLHAARADAGPASMYAMEEERAEKQVLAMNQIGAAGAAGKRGES
jgi:hypothetical protein